MRISSDWLNIARQAFNQYRHQIITLLALICCLPGAVSEPDTETAHIYPNATAYEMTSATGRRFQIFLAWPNKPPPIEGYSVVYHLDGNAMFGTITDSVRSYARRRDVEKDAIVVGIGYPADLNAGRERRFDLTPAIGSEHPEGTGGAEDFMDFIGNELMPDIHARFAVNTEDESIFGHSFGGLFVLYTLVNHPEMFDTYLAASPSIWFEEEMIKRNNVRKRLVPKLQVTGATPIVLITAGEYEQADDPLFPSHNLDALMERAMVDNAREFAEFVDGLDGASASFKRLDGHNHGSVVPVAISEALRLVFTSGSEKPSPAEPPVPFENETGVPILSGEDYLALSPEERYAQRMNARNLEGETRENWLEAFDFSLASGLTYLDHRLLHEERVEMDTLNETASPEGD